MVIAIIAVLAALLLPALSQAKAISRDIICTSRHQQMYVAVSVYDLDYHQIPPLGSFAYHQIDDLLDMPDNPIFECTRRMSPVVNFNSLAAPYNTNAPYERGFHGYMIWVGAPNWWDSGWGAWSSAGSFPSTTGARNIAMHRLGLSDFLFFGDKSAYGRAYGYGYSVPNAAGEHSNSSFAFDHGRPQLAIGSNGGNVTFNGRGIFAMGDGHVVSMKKEEAATYIGRTNCPNDLQ